MSPKIYIGRKRKNDLAEIVKFKNEIKSNNEGYNYAKMIYKLDKNLFEESKYMILFGKEFAEKNKNKFKIIVAGKEYEMVHMIYVKNFKKYGINKEDELLTVILNGETIKNMSYMFYDCKSLIKVDLSSFNTQNVKNMESMFGGCENLVKVDLSSFNTQNVENMACMFSGCKSLIKVDLLSFNTQNLKEVEFMFYECENLIKVDFSSFNTQNLKKNGNCFRKL